MKDTLTPAQKDAIKRLPSLFQERGIPRTDPYTTCDWGPYGDCKQVINEVERELGIHVRQTGIYATDFYDASMKQTYRYLGM